MGQKAVDVIFPWIILSAGISKGRSRLAYPRKGAADLGLHDRPDRVKTFDKYR
jgi:hypothetical protein